MEEKREKKPPHISNPLSLLAIFACLSEGAGAAVLPFISGWLQACYVIFLVFYPLALTTTFIWILLVRPHKLYGPSDYRSDEMFAKFNARPLTPEENLKQLLSSDALAIEGGEEIGTHGEVVKGADDKPDETTSLRTADFARTALVQRLVLSYLGRLYGIPFQGPSAITLGKAGKSLFVFDAAAQPPDRPDKLFAAEVKFIRSESMAMNQINEFLQLVSEIKPRPSENEIYLILVLVIREENTKDISRMTEANLNAYFAREIPSTYKEFVRMHILREDELIHQGMLDRHEVKSVTVHDFPGKVTAADSSSNEL